MADHPCALPGDLLSWTDDLWTQVFEQLLSEQSVRVQLAGQRVL